MANDFLGTGSGSYPSSPQTVTPYPNQFLDIASTRMPKSVKQLFMLAEFYVLQTPLVASALMKKSAYPITSLVYDAEETKIIEHWQEILEDTMELPESLITANLNYYTYGNCFISLHRPIRKTYKCKVCGFSEELIKAEKLRVHNEKLLIQECKKCHTVTPDIEIIDQFVQDKKRIRLVFWDPNRIGIIYNSITGERQYTYDLPELDRTKIINLLMPLSELVKIEQPYIEAALSVNKKVLKFKPDQIFHMKAPSIAGVDPAWGYPIILSSIKDLYYLQILKKANEAIMLGHIVPMKYIYPAPGVGAADTAPFGGMNLRVWKEQILQDLARWRKDPNYIPIFPLPVGQGTFGGEGKSLMTQAEMNEMSKQILAGVGVPQEFVFGGLQWSGTNVSLRMMENEFLGLRKQDLKLLRFIIKSVSTLLKLAPIDIHFSEFKMADDAQRKQFLMNMYQSGILSLDTLMDEFGLDWRKELSKKTSETKEMEEMQKKSQLSSVRVNFEAQKAQQEFEAILQKRQQELLGQPPLPGSPLANSMQNEADINTPDSPGPTPQMQQLNTQVSTQMEGADKQVKPPQNNPEKGPPRGTNKQI